MKNHFYYDNGCSCRQQLNVANIYCLLMLPQQTTTAGRIVPKRERDILSLIISNAPIFDQKHKAGLPFTYAEGNEIIRQTNDQIDIVGKLLSKQVKVKHRRYSI